MTYARRMPGNSDRIEVWMGPRSEYDLADNDPQPPNFVLLQEHVNDLVAALARFVDDDVRNALIVGWLRGPEGPPGPVGPMGMSA